jgi:hypothetical protein
LFPANFPGFFIFFLCRVHAVLKIPFPEICRSAFKASAKIKLDFETTKFILQLFSTALQSNASLAKRVQM